MLCYVMLCDTTHFDFEDDYRTGCRNVSHCQQQQSYSGLRSPGRSNSTYYLKIIMIMMKYNKKIKKIYFMINKKGHKEK